MLGIPVALIALIVGVLSSNAPPIFGELSPDASQGRAPPAASPPGAGIGLNASTSRRLPACVTLLIGDVFTQGIICGRLLTALPKDLHESTA